MKTALAQIDVVPNDPEKNVGQMLEYIERAKREGAELVVFPEMCVSGYLVGDKVRHDAWCEEMMSFNRKLCEASKGITIAYGNIFLDTEINQRVDDELPHPNKDGTTRRYNAVYVFTDGRPAKRVEEWTYLPEGVQPKTLLPTYRFFDDERYFFSLADVAQDFGVDVASLYDPFLIPFTNKQGHTEHATVGFNICEDGIWCEDYRLGGKAFNTTKMLVENGASVVVNLSASPWTYGKNSTRDRLAKSLADSLGDESVPLLYVNCVGAQNNGKNIVTFDGATTVYNSQGHSVRHIGEPYLEEMITVELEEIDDLKVRGRLEKEEVGQKVDALLRGLRAVPQMAGSTSYPRIVAGLSGGVDSAVGVALLALAYGKDKILAVNMPSQFNSEKTIDAAEKIAAALDIAYMSVPIGDLVAFKEAHLKKFDAMGFSLTSNAQGNLHARTRSMDILSELAAAHGALYPSFGNKLEVAVGYATLDGDCRGAIAPIADCDKVDVFKIATYLNAEVFGKEVIPMSLIPDELFRFEEGKIAPTAELDVAQIDPMKFGYHDALLRMMMNFRPTSSEEIAEMFVSGELHSRVGEMLGQDEEYGCQLLKRWGVDEPEAFVDDLDWFSRLIDSNVFKRVQSVPTIIVTKTAYGFDRRESIMAYRKSGKMNAQEHKIRPMKRYKEGIA